jgi:hypothetical protein
MSGEKMEVGGKEGNVRGRSWQELWASAVLPLASVPAVVKVKWLLCGLDCIEAYFRLIHY